MFFDMFVEVKKVYNKEYVDYKGKGGKKKKIFFFEELKKIGDFNLYFIFVDVVLSGNFGKMEYCGVDI